MRRLIGGAAGASMAMSLAFATPATAVQPADAVRCESSGGRTRECTADASGGARLLRQLSRSACIEGDTWGRTRQSIWVTRGCRGDFIAIAGGRGDAGERSTARTLRCSSEKARWTHCNADTRRGVEFTRQLSRSPCIRGQSWDMDGSGVWVNGGCRAEFRIGAEVASPQAEARRFRCESKHGRMRSCAADTRGDVRVAKQLSQSPCIAGRTWGLQRDGVWVSNGCRAEFESGWGSDSDARAQGR